MSWTIATWNVNSLKARQEQVLCWLQDNQVDILALQELKTLQLSPEVFTGYNVYYIGQKAYNGVAVFSKEPAVTRPVEFLMHAPEAQARFLAVEFANVTVVCVYVPNGSDISSDKYVYKLAWLDALEAWLTVKLQQAKKLVILGDFNIAPFAEDTYDSKLWDGKVLASEPERLRYRNLLELGLIDLHSGDDRFTWWDYRAGAFPKNNGCRIDLILANKALEQDLINYKIDKLPRSWPKPSDHCPVLATFSGCYA